MVIRVKKLPGNIFLPLALAWGRQIGKFAQTRSNFWVTHGLWDVYGNHRCIAVPYNCELTEGFLNLE